MAPSPAPAALDYAALTADDVDTKELKSNRPRENSVDLAPFVAWLTDSKARGVGKAIAVPESAVKGTMTLIRRAADSMDNVGVAIRAGKPQENGNVSVKFIAQDKRKADPNKPRRPYRKTAWSDEDYAKATHEWIAAITAYLTENGQADKVETATAAAKADLTKVRAAIREARKTA